jgi:hypothetical protein
VTLAEVLGEARQSVQKVRHFLNVSDDPPRDVLTDILDEIDLLRQQVRRARIIVDEGRDPVP